MAGRQVTENAAEVYAATLSFLNAAKAADDVDATKVITRLRGAPIKDSLFGTASIRSDGRVVYDLNVYRVKVRLWVKGKRPLSPVYDPPWDRA